MPRKEDIRKIDQIVKQEKLSKEQRRLLHDEISGQKLSLEEIRDIARDLKKLYPNK